MAALIVIGVLFLLFFLIGQIRVGVDFNFSDNRITLTAMVMGVRIPLIPKREKAQKKPSEKPEPEKKTTDKKPERSERVRKKKKLFFKIDLQDICEMLSGVARGLRIFRRGFRLKRLLIHFTAASRDPYTTAQLSAYANAFLSVFIPLIDNAEHCRDCDVRTAVDFEKLRPELDFGICIMFRIGAAVEMAFYTLFALLGVFLKIMFRFLWMKWRDPEEYDFRMNQQENPIAFFRRILRESRALNEEMKEETEEIKEEAKEDPIVIPAEDRKETAEERNGSDGKQ